MKKLVIPFLLLVFAFGHADAQLMFNSNLNDNIFNGLSENSWYSHSNKKKNKGRDKKEKKAEAETVDMQMAFGGGLFLGIPLGDFGKSVAGGSGINLEGEYFIEPQISAGLNTGYYVFQFDKVMRGDGKSKIIPILLKGSYYLFYGAFKPYAGLGLGIFMIDESYSRPTIKTINYNVALENKETKFGFTPTIGLMYNLADVAGIRISPDFNLHFNIKYTMIFKGDKVLSDQDNVKDFKLKNKNFVAFNLGLLYSL